VGSSNVNIERVRKCTFSGKLIFISIAGVSEEIGRVLKINLSSAKILKITFPLLSLKSGLIPTLLYKNWQVLFQILFLLLSRIFQFHPVVASITTRVSSGKNKNNQ